jgi:hypothetical protein
LIVIYIKGIDMTTKHENSNLSIIEAVETLSNIADMDIDKGVGVAEEHHLIIQNKPISYKTVNWIKHRNGDRAVGAVKEIFKVILDYLQTFYKNDYNKLKNENTIEGIKTLMVLVGEAAKKLDKYTNILDQPQSQSVTELNEYKKLQEFYLSHVARKIDEGTLGKWILGLTQKTWEDKSKAKLLGRKSSQTKHVFIDLESVKKDTDYDLFFLRKEDGTRFFSPRLIRNIKLVSDFGDAFGERKGDDPLASLSLWQDKLFHCSAKQLGHCIEPLVNQFYTETRKCPNNELAIALKKTIMALFLAGQPRNLLRNNPSKSCTEYFSDFQKFLGEALRSRDYQKLMAFPPEKNSIAACLLIDIIHKLCSYFFINLQGFQEIIPNIQALLQEAIQSHSEEHKEITQPTKRVWNRLVGNYSAMMKLLKRHSNGPLTKVLEVLQDGDYQQFDPIGQNNIPSQLFSLLLNEKQLINVRIPSPTYQEFIHKAQIKDEFKAFLHNDSKEQSETGYLMINLQDRTSWREHFRSKVLEELQNNGEFSKNLTVVTMPVDTEFYNQLAPYNTDNQVAHFSKHFKSNFGDENCGFYFPDKILKLLSENYIEQMFNAIHRIFFSNKNVLTREQRLNFIEIFYLFFYFKLFDIASPKTFSFTCKDCIDSGGAKSALLFVALKLFKGEYLSERDFEQLDMIIYGPSLLIRERNMLPEKFNRMIGAIKTLELAKEELGPENFKKMIQKTFSPFYNSAIFDTKIILPDENIMI